MRRWTDSGRSRPTRSCTRAHPGQAGGTRQAAAVVIPAADRHASAIADVQSVLGDHQDAVVAEAWLRRAVTEGRVVPESFAAGLLVTMEREQAARYRRWRSAWKDASRKKLTSWLPG